VQVFNVNPNGSVGASGIFLTDDGGATPTMRITESASQTQNVLEVNNLAGTRLLTIGPAGTLYAPNLYGLTTNRPYASLREKTDLQSIPSSTWTNPEWDRFDLRERVRLELRKRRVALAR